MKSRPWLSKEKKECDIQRDHLKALKQDNWLVNFMKLLFLLHSAWAIIQISPISTLSLPPSFVEILPSICSLICFFFNLFFCRSPFLLQHAKLVCFTEYHLIFMLLGILLSKLTEDPPFSCVRLLHLRLVSWVFACCFYFHWVPESPVKKDSVFLKRDHFRCTGQWQGGKASIISD